MATWIRCDNTGDWITAVREHFQIGTDLISVSNFDDEDFELKEWGQSMGYDYSYDEPNRTGNFNKRKLNL